MGGVAQWAMRPLRLARGRQLASDVLFAVALFTADMALTVLAPRQLRPDSWPVAVLLSAACVVPIALRRVAPWPAVAGTVATLLGPGLFHYSPTTHVASILVVTYTLAARMSMRSATAAWLVMWLPMFVIGIETPQPFVAANLSSGYLTLNNLLSALVAFFVGRTVHARRVSAQALEERARAAEANQRATAKQAVADERRRIARELHDVVAHHVSVMGVLATGARRVLDRAPEAADEALATIEDTSRGTLREMRRLLNVLRSDAEPAAAELAPQPDIAGISALVDQVREAGLAVTLNVYGEPTGLDPGVALTVYRIVQEALTNTIKHAGQATAEVRMRFGVYWLTVEVEDTGRGPTPGGTPIGHGLVGMRERVALYGGMLRTGPRPGGGYRVYARIPLDHPGGGKGAP